MLENIISEWIRCINKYYEFNRDVDYGYFLPNIDNHQRNDMKEFVEANEVLVQEKANTSTTVTTQYHPQAYYTSRKLTEISAQEESQGFDCMIED
ncbi:uncharacterized protein OCT59_020147 [Rhizophagus irregularis]|nr:hypothetical protein OCT59_020147 [Rhizophagus irregularis]